MDRVSKATRSRIMASVRSKGNRSTERLMAKVLRKEGLRGYRTQWMVPGKPDFAWPDRKIALFVDGCFWHGCPRCNRPSKSHVGFWRKKVSDNRRRDLRVSRRLRRQGWNVLRVWECVVTSARTAQRIRKALAVRPTTRPNPGRAIHA
jgi:DNA mismatch endonuclease (patch repair protein)